MVSICHMLDEYRDTVMIRQVGNRKKKGGTISGYQKLKDHQLALLPSRSRNSISLVSSHHKSSRADGEEVRIRPEASIPLRTAAEGPALSEGGQVECYIPRVIMY